MVDSYFVIENSSSEFNLNENDKLWETNIKITEPEMFWIGVTIPEGGHLFQLPVRGYSSTDSQENLYDWLVNYGDGSPIEHVRNLGSSTGLVDGHTYEEGGYYTIKVKPVNDYVWFGWARAFGCGSYDDAGNTKSFITNGGKFSWTSLALSGNSVGNYFNREKFYGCSNLVVPEDTSDWYISGSQGNYFNAKKYQYCDNLTVPEDTSNWSISGSQGTDFNAYKYYGCPYLKATEDTSNWSISGSQGIQFNTCKYYNCKDLIYPEDTSNWSISGSQGEYFNGIKYSGCGALCVPEDTSGWSIYGNQANSFNNKKYENCNNLSSLEDWSGFGTLETTASSTDIYLCHQMYYLNNPNTTMQGNTTVMRSKFPAGAQDNPPYAIATFHNRTGLDDYDTLNNNWK